MLSSINLSKQPLTTQEAGQYARRRQGRRKQATVPLPPSVSIISTIVRPPPLHSPSLPPSLRLSLRLSLPCIPLYSIRKKTQAELVAERQAQALDHLDHPPDAAQTGPAPGVAQAGAAAGAAGPAASPTAGTAVEMDCDMAQALWFVLCLFSAALALLGFSPAVPPLPREVFFHEAALFSIICLTSRMCAAAFSCASWPERLLFDAQSTTHWLISQSGNSNSHYNTPM